MATAKIAYRKSAIGISAGLGIALPLAAYAATLPFDSVNEAVRMDAMPFAAGIVAGVGMLTLTGHLLDARADRVEAEEAEAAQFASIFSDSDAVVPRTARTERDAARTGKRFAGNAAPKGVPVISRATDAMDELDAWAEIDAMFTGDSPISCDPARSKDVYQIAFEELRRAEQAAKATVPADSTALYVSLANGQVAKAPSTTVSAQAAAPSVAPRPHAIALEELDLDEPAVLTEEQRQEESDRDAAMQALYGAAATSKAEAASQAATITTVATPEGDVLTVPMADYSGHEDMWASALAILAEEPVALDVAQPGLTQSEVAAPSETSFVPRSRMAAVAEGGNATKVHSQVNSMLEDEFDKAPSKSVHHTAHEYLKVIEGGTASMPTLKAAEA